MRKQIDLAKKSKAHPPVKKTAPVPPFLPQKLDVPVMPSEQPAFLREPEAPQQRRSNWLSWMLLFFLLILLGLILYVSLTNR